MTDVYSTTRIRIKESIDINGYGGSDNYVLQCKVVDYADSRASLLTMDIADKFWDTYTLQEGDIIEVWQRLEPNATLTDDDKIFKGRIVSITRDFGKTTVKAQDMLIDAIKATVDHIFLDTDQFAGNVQSIFIELVTNYAGLNADTSSVQDPGIVLKRFVCKEAGVNDMLTKLEKAVGWYHYYNPKDDKVYFEPRGFSTNPNTLVVGEHIPELPKWQHDFSEIANWITVIGDTVQDQRTEFFSGDGSTTEFEVSQRPVAANVWVNGTEQVVENEDMIDETATVHMSQYKKSFTFKTAPPAGTDNIKIQYYYNRPIKVVMKDEDSYHTYNQWYKKTFVIIDAKTRADAERYGRKLLEVYAYPFKNVKVKVVKAESFGLAAGQVIRVVDNVDLSRRSLDEELVIQSLTYTYPYTGFEATIGDKELKLNSINFDVTERVRKLEEKTLNQGDILLQIVTLPQNLKIKRLERNVRANFICDSFILGHPLNGQLGRGDIINDFEDATDWTVTENAAATTLSDNTSEYQVGSQSVKLTIDNSPATEFVNVIIETTNVPNDISDYVGTTSGDPTEGTVGLWIYDPIGGLVREDSSMYITFETDSSNYYETNAGEIIWHHAGYSGTDFPTETQVGWNYIVFHLKNSHIFNNSQQIGTVNWQNITKVKVRLYVKKNNNISLDYLTIGDGHEIGLNGLGERKVSVEVSSSSG